MCSEMVLSIPSGELRDPDCATRLSSSSSLQLESSLDDKLLNSSTYNNQLSPEPLSLNRNCANNQSPCATDRIFSSAFSPSSSPQLLVLLPRQAPAKSMSFDTDKTTTVWVKRGICSCDSIINIALCMLGYLPGLIHAWVHTPSP